MRPLISDPVYTHGHDIKLNSFVAIMRYPHGHDIKLNSFEASLALKIMIILQNFITNNHGKSNK